MCDVFTYVALGGYLTGQVALQLFSRSGLERSVLAGVWSLADLDGDSKLSESEFIIALHLISLAMKGFALPSSTPPELVLNADAGAGVRFLSG